MQAFFSLKLTHLWFSLILLCCLLFTSLSHAKRTSNIELKESISLGSTKLLLNGAGQRSKFFIDLYVAALYLSEKSQDAEDIINTDSTMMIQIHVISNLITSENLIRGTREGFNKSTNDQTASIQEQIDEFLSAFDSPIVLGDIFEIVYQPEKGVTVIKNRHVVKKLQSDLAFKKALFGVWLSKKPAQQSLKEDLLGY